MCITESGKVFVRLKNGTIREFTEAAAEYARELLGDMTNLYNDISEIVQSATTISDDTVEQILNLTSQNASMLQDIQGYRADVLNAKDAVDTAKASVDSSEETALDAKDDAEDSANLAEKWANYMDGTVDGNEYSSKYYATQVSDTKDYVDEALVNVENFAASAQQSADYAQNLVNMYEVTTDMVDDIVLGETSGGEGD